MAVCVPHVYLGSDVAQKRALVPWNWCYRRLLPVLWVLGMALGSLTTAACGPKSLAFFPAPIMCYFYSKSSYF